jgi:hypothetical protein
MMTSVTDDTTPFPVLPTILSPDHVYDMLMGEIEPELVSTVVHTLKEKYTAETAEQATARAARYTAAFAEYEKQLTTYVADLNAAIRQYARAAAVSLETSGRSIDNALLETLDTAMQSS